MVVTNPPATCEHMSNLIPPGLTSISPSLPGRPPQSREATTVPRFIDPFRLAVLVMSRRGTPVRLITNILPATAPFSVTGSLTPALRNPPEPRTSLTSMTPVPVPGILTLTAFPLGTGVTTWTFRVVRSRVTLLLRPPTPETCIFLVGRTLQRATAGFMAVWTAPTRMLKPFSILTTWPPPVPRLLLLTDILRLLHPPSRPRAGHPHSANGLPGPTGAPSILVPSMAPSAVPLLLAVIETLTLTRVEVVVVVVTLRCLSLVCRVSSLCRRRTRSGVVMPPLVLVRRSLLVVVVLRLTGEVVPLLLLPRLLVTRRRESLLPPLVTRPPDALRVREALEPLLALLLLLLIAFRVVPWQVLLTVLLLLRPLPRPATLNPIPPDTQLTGPRVPSMTATALAATQARNVTVMKRRTVASFGGLTIPLKARIINTLRPLFGPKTRSLKTGARNPVKAMDD